MQEEVCDTFPPPPPPTWKILWQNYHNGLGVFSSSMYMNGLWADKQQKAMKKHTPNPPPKKKKKKKKNHRGGDAPVPPFSPPPPTTVALHLITLISHKPWVPYYQTLSSINIHIYMEIYQNWPLTFHLQLDGLHRYDPWSIIKIPTKLYHNWTLLPGVVTSCTMALYLYIGYMHTVRYECTMYIVYIATFLKL